MDPRIEANRAHWDELVGVHVASAHAYYLQSFRAGGSTLRGLEVAEVGDVRGKRLLHLQCHFGMGTISWALRGARATGVDFSPVAIELARRLATELRVRAEFVCSDIYGLPERLNGEFDVVFTSYGVLSWLPDLAEWGRVISRFLKPGGFFYIAEQHPAGALFSEGGGHPVACEETANGSCAEPGGTVRNGTSYEWEHGFPDIINALTDAGLRVEFVHEFPFCTFQRLPAMVKGDDGWWRLPGNDNVPFLFSVKASKDSPQARRSPRRLASRLRLLGA